MTSPSEDPRTTGTVNTAKALWFCRYGYASKRWDVDMSLCDRTHDAVPTTHSTSYEFRCWVFAKTSDVAKQVAHEVMLARHDESE